MSETEVSQPSRDIHRHSPKERGSMLSKTVVPNVAFGHHPALRVDRIMSGLPPNADDSAFQRLRLPRMVTIGAAGQ